MAIYEHKLKNDYIGEYKEWEPGANTLAYFPFESDGLDVLGNYTLSNTGTQQTLGRRFTSQSLFSSTPTNVNTALVRLKLNSIGTANYVQVMRCIARNLCFYVQGNPNNPCFWTYIQPNNYEGGSHLIGTGQRYLIGITRSKSGSTTTLKGYVNGTEYSIFTGTMPQDTPDNSGLIFTNQSVNMDLSRFIIESKTWTAQEIQEYYNQTKSKYIGEQTVQTFDFQNDGLLGCTLSNTQYFGYEAGQGIYASTGSTDISIGCSITLPSNVYGDTLKSVELEVYYPSGGYGNAFGVIVNNGYSFRYSREENRNQQVNTREYVGFADGKTSPYYNVGTKSGELVLTYNFTNSTISGEIGGTSYNISDSYANTFMNSFADGTFRLLIVTWSNPNRAYIRKATITTNS